MSRELITVDELKAWLTAELQKIEDYEEGSVAGVTLLQLPDETGCNWSEMVTVRAGGISGNYYQPRFKQIIAEARQRFNVRIEDANN